MKIKNYSIAKQTLILSALDKYVYSLGNKHCSFNPYKIKKHTPEIASVNKEKLNPIEKIVITQLLYFISSGASFLNGICKTVTTADSAMTIPNMTTSPTAAPFKSAKLRDMWVLIEYTRNKNTQNIGLFIFFLVNSPLNKPIVCCHIDFKI